MKIHNVPAARGDGSDRGGVSALLVAGTLVLITLIVTSGVVLMKSGLLSREGDSVASRGDAPAGDSVRPGDVEPEGSTSRTGQAAGAQDEWVADINAYCRVIDRRLKQVPVDGADLPQYREKSGVLRTMNRELRQRKVPEEHRRTYDRMLDAWDKSAAYLLEVATAIDDQTLMEMYDYGRKQSDANRRGNLLAHELDLDDCAGAGGLPEDE